MLQQIWQNYPYGYKKRYIRMDISLLIEIHGINNWLKEKLGKLFPLVYTHFHWSHVCWKQNQEKGSEIRKQGLWHCTSPPSVTDGSLLHFSPFFLQLTWFRPISCLKHCHRLKIGLPSNLTLLKSLLHTAFRVKPLMVPPNHMVSPSSFLTA